VAAKQKRIVHTAATLNSEVTRATKELERPTKGEPLTVSMRPQDIDTRPELFQPRIFSHGLREVDDAHVKKLMRRIGTVGELYPVVVIKLSGRWVCVDGHHRLEAYIRLKWQEPIRAAWFPGGVREALDHAVVSNEVVKLEIPDGDRFEVAWQRVVLGWGSKADIARIADVSERLVGNMRVVKKQYEKDDAFGRKFRKDLGAPLHEVTWTRARMTRDGITPGQIDKHEEALKLSRVLSSRLHGKLSEDPEVTARALALYDRYLPQPLVSELNKFTQKVNGEEIPTYPRASLAHMAKDELLQNIERIEDAQAILRRQKHEAMAELERRAAGGSRSDETWDNWLREADNEDTA
jgi:hypothetical protein